MKRIQKGLGEEGDIEQLLTLSDNIAGRTICALGDAAALPVKSFIQHFRPEFEYLIKHKKSQVESI